MQQKAQVCGNIFHTSGDYSLRGVGRHSSQPVELQKEYNGFGAVTATGQLLDAARNAALPVQTPSTDGLWTG